ncbi:hypothetical protein C8R45DRAFT_1095852 [Mycena sanguinolenta]|nr:hypothetical protein C8R45DRAFT_1095852 [Mycena sanguinolenta]
MTKEGIAASQRGRVEGLNAPPPIGHIASIARDRYCGVGAGIDAAHLHALCIRLATARVLTTPPRTTTTVAPHPALCLCLSPPRLFFLRVYAPHPASPPTSVRLAAGPTIRVRLRLNLNFTLGPRRRFASWALYTSARHSPQRRLAYDGDASALRLPLPPLPPPPPPPHVSDGKPTGKRVGRHARRCTVRSRIEDPGDWDVDANTGGDDNHDESRRG